MRWAARISGLLLAVVVGAFLFGSAERLSGADTTEAVQMAFFLVMGAGWIVGWVAPALGGWMTVFGWIGFQVVEWTIGGRPVVDPQFLAMLVPGVLFLVSANRSSDSGARGG